MNIQSKFLPLQILCDFQRDMVIASRSLSNKVLEIVYEFSFVIYSVIWTMYLEYSLGVIFAYNWRMCSRPLARLEMKHSLGTIHKIVTYFSGSFSHNLLKRSRCRYLKIMRFWRWKSTIFHSLRFATQLNNLNGWNNERKNFYFQLACHKTLMNFVLLGLECQ